MKKLICFLMLMCMVVLSGICFGAEVVAPATAAVATAPAAGTAFQGIINWMLVNQVVVGILLAAILDFIFAINPEWKSNGALHFIYEIAKKKSETPPPAAPPA